MLKMARREDFFSTKELGVDFIFAILFGFRLVNKDSGNLRACRYIWRHLYCWPDVHCLFLLYVVTLWAPLWQLSLSDLKWSGNSWENKTSSVVFLLKSVTLVTGYMSYEYGFFFSLEKVWHSLQRNIVLILNMKFYISVTEQRITLIICALQENAKSCGLL